MENILEIADKIFDVLGKEERLKCSFFRRDEDLCYIKVENYNNDNEDCIIINDEIFFEIDDEEYYPLNEYEKATITFLEKLDKVFNVYISGRDDNGEIIEYGYCTNLKDKNALIEEAVDRLKNEYSFINNVDKMKVSNFYGDFGFQAKWDGKLFIENSSIKR